MPSANSYSSPSTTGGNREDLTDILSIIAPEATPVVSAIRTGPMPNATYTETLVDTLRAARNSGSPEGRDQSVFSNKASNRARIGNYIHILDDSFGVTDVESKVDVAGAKGGLYAEAKAKAVTELKRDMEAVVCGDQDRQSGTGDTGWKTRGLFDWIDSAGPSDVPAAVRTNSSAITAGHSEANITAILQALFNQYGEPKNFFLPAGLTICKDMDTLAATVTSANVGVNNNLITGKSVNRTINRYVTSMGSFDIVPDVFLSIDSAGAGAADKALFLNLDLLELRFLENLHTVDMEDKGGGPRGYVKTIFSLICKNPLGLGKMTA